MSETLDLTHLTDASFVALYKARVEPLFAAGEKERLDAVAKFRKGMAISVALALVLLAGILGFGGEAGAAIFCAAAALLIGYAIAYSPLRKLGQRMKQAALTAISDAIGVQYRPDVSPLTMPRFRRLDLVPAYDRCKFEDHFHGERHGCAFDLWEAHLEVEHRDKDGKRSHQTVFRGVQIRMAFPKPFLGVTIVRRDAGIFNALRGLGDFKRVGLVDPRFERTFEVYSNDQVEARYLVHPVFMERLLHLEDTFGGRRVRCAFDEGDLLLAVETADKFEIGDMFKPLADPARARRIVNDIADVISLMDAVLTAEQAPLVARRSE
jgi:hypothetical protein